MQRVVLIGDSYVGKTSLIQKKINSEISTRYEETVGAAFHTYSAIVNKQKHVIQVWDTAGQEKYKSLGPVYYRNSCAAILVYDVTNRSSFDSLPQWIKTYKEVTCGKGQIIIVANKVDLDSLSVVEDSEGMAFAESQNMLFVSTSALTGFNVSFLFQQVAQIVVNMYIEECAINEQKRALKEKEENKSKLCC